MYRCHPVLYVQVSSSSVCTGVIQFCTYKCHPVLYAITRLCMYTYLYFRMKTAESQYLDAFKDELTSFVDRIKRRAQSKLEAAMKEVEEVCTYATPTVTQFIHI